MFQAIYGARIGHRSWCIYHNMMQEQSPLLTVRIAETAQMFYNAYKDLFGKTKTFTLH